MRALPAPSRKAPSYHRTLTVSRFDAAAVISQNVRDAEGWERAIISLVASCCAEFDIAL
jgi:hypothetical protein